MKKIKDIYRTSNSVNGHFLMLQDFKFCKWADVTTLFKIIFFHFTQRRKYFTYCTPYYGYSPPAIKFPWVLIEGKTLVTETTVLLKYSKCFPTFLNTPIRWDKKTHSD